MVVPVGTLDVSTHALLRDTLIEVAADLPVAIVLDLDKLAYSRTSALSLFPTVTQRLAEWPGVPLLLVGRRGTAAAMQESTVAHFVVPFRTVAAAIISLGAPPPRRRAVLELTGQSTDPHRARHWLAELGTEWGLETDVELVDDAVLVASELVENAVRHAPGSATSAWSCGRPA